MIMLTFFQRTDASSSAGLVAPSAISDNRNSGMPSVPARRTLTGEGAVDFQATHPNPEVGVEPGGTQRLNIPLSREVAADRTPPWNVRS
jgi:hypothetical protein